MWPCGRGLCTDCARNNSLPQIVAWFCTQRETRGSPLRGGYRGQAAFSPRPLAALPRSLLHQRCRQTSSKERATLCPKAGDSTGQTNGAHLWLTHTSLPDTTSTFVFLRQVCTHPVWQHCSSLSPGTAPPPSASWPCRASPRRLHLLHGKEGGRAGKVVRFGLITRGCNAQPKEDGSRAPLVCLRVLCWGHTAGGWAPAP